MDAKERTESGFDFDCDVMEAIERAIRAAEIEALEFAERNLLLCSTGCHGFGSCSHCQSQAVPIRARIAELRKEQGE